MSVIAIGTAMANARRGQEQRIWEVFAYVARYGHQPLSELRAMTMQDLRKLTEELSAIVKYESTPREA